MLQESYKNIRSTLPPQKKTHILPEAPNLLLPGFSFRQMAWQEWSPLSAVPLGAEPGQPERLVGE